MRWFLAICVAAGPLWAGSAPAVLAAGCPEAPDLSAQIDPLYEALQHAPDAQAALGIVNQMWLLWDNAPDAASQEILNEGMQARADFDLRIALERFDSLITYCPDYAEGYNQRAFVHVIGGDYAAALPDLDRAVALNPRHLGALSGRALTLLALGQEEAGQAALRTALKLHPLLPERRFLTEPAGDEL